MIINLTDEYLFPGFKSMIPAGHVVLVDIFYGNSFTGYLIKGELVKTVSGRIDNEDYDSLAKICKKLVEGHSNNVSHETSSDIIKSES